LVLSFVVARATTAPQQASSIHFENLGALSASAKLFDSLVVHCALRWLVRSQFGRGEANISRDRLKTAWSRAAFGNGNRNTEYAEFYRGKADAKSLARSCNCHLKWNNQPNNIVLVPANKASWPQSSHILALPNLFPYCWPSENGYQSEGVASCVQTDQQTP